jgi:neutral ceramidase
MSRAKASSELCVGLARAVITPPPRVALAGYFSPRFNRGVRDDLYVRVCLFRQGKVTAGIVQLDLCEMQTSLYEAMRQRFNAISAGLGDQVMVAVTHTHTGPETRVTRDAAHQHALDFIVDQAEAAMRTALWRFVPVELRALSIVNNPFAYNRRYWMTDGRVVTNPGKLNPAIVRPEGPVDRQVHAVLLFAQGFPAGMIVNLTNHTDTIGEDRVSADWPGFLERSLQAALGCQIPVLTLVAPSGNINHFDVTSAQGQTCYEEARRIGEGYADIILRSLDEATPIPPAPLAFANQTFTLQRRKVTLAELRQARALLAKPEADTGVYTSEDLARGVPGVLRFFAEQLVSFAKHDAGRTADFPLMALRLGQDTAIASLPGEPFTEIGMGVRQQSPFQRTLLASLANGCPGYIVMDECFERGGYEQLPIEDAGAGKGTAQALQAGVLQALERVAP